MKALVDEVRNERGGEVMLSPEDRVVVENVSRRRWWGLVEGREDWGSRAICDLLVALRCLGRMLVHGH